MSRLDNLGFALGRGQLPQVYRTSSDADDIDFVFVPVRSEGFKLLYVRAHFREGSGTADLALSVDSVAGEEWDVKLYVAKSRGLGADLNLVITKEEISDPSPWAFQAGDGLRVQWTNPGGVKWGVEIGYEGL